MVLRSHLLAAAAFGPCAASELALAETLWEQLPDRSLTVVDREFCTYALFHRLADPARDRHWLTRAKKALSWDVVEPLGPGDALVELRPSRMTRTAHPALPAAWRVQAVRYQRRGFRPQTLLASLLAPVAYPAADIVALYHERWELELGFDEMKTHTLEREEALLRSKSPTRIDQELWGLLVGYTLVRLAMARVAADAGVAPTRISFRHALNFIRVFWLTGWLASPGVILTHLTRACHAAARQCEATRLRPLRVSRANTRLPHRRHRAGPRLHAFDSLIWTFSSACLSTYYLRAVGSMIGPPEPG